MARSAHTRLQAGISLLSAAAVLGVAISIFNFFWPGNGIHGSYGAGLVIGSTVLMTISSILIAFDLVAWRWLRVVLMILVLLDILGTAFAAILLESWVLFAFMVIALAGWVWHLFGDGHVAAVEMSPEAAE